MSNLDSSPGTSTNVTSTPTVLVVDDDPHSRFLVRSGLERRGWQVLEADSGESAIALVRMIRIPVQAAVLDFVPKALDEVATFKALQKLRPGLRALWCRTDPERAVVCPQPPQGLVSMPKWVVLSNLDALLKKVLVSPSVEGAQAEDAPRPERPGPAGRAWVQPSGAANAAG